MHVRAARRNGLTAEQISEVLLHAAIYCGVPAANVAFAVANASAGRGGLSEALMPDDYLFSTPQLDDPYPYYRRAAGRRPGPLLGHRGHLGADPLRRLRGAPSATGRRGPASSGATS